MVDYFPQDDRWLNAMPMDLHPVEEYIKRSETLQLVILKAGRKLLDLTFSPEPVEVFGVQKGVFALLLGIARERDLIQLGDRTIDLFGEGWTKLARHKEAEITVRHLLTMTTGLDDDSAGLGEIGETWRYDNTSYNYLKDALSDRIGETLQDMTSQWLLDPLGMKQTKWVERSTLLPNGKPLTGLLSTAEDLARVGLLLLRRGHWGNQQLIEDQDYLDLLSQPGSEANPAWGLYWWNNNQSKWMRPMRLDVYEGPIIPSAPHDLIAARGAFGNCIHVVPSLDLVIARTADPGGDRSRPFEEEFWSRLAPLIIP